MNDALSQEAMEKAKAMFPPKAPEAPTATGNGPRLDVGAYLDHHKKPYRIKTIDAGTLYILLDGCFFD